MRDAIKNVVTKILYTKQRKSQKKVIPVRFCFKMLVAGVWIYMFYENVFSRVIKKNYTIFP
ncbi:hypothetical protein BUZ78_11400 [Staphylococcus saprophyticus]|nr:hypothetical protein BUZ78_11400 [Staphylococcus saprophyticus]RIO32110.1 hypothetical protein BUZ79_09410 [Staphylococcus saprophyticus]